MSNVITPVPDALDAQHAVLIDEEHKREVQVRLLSDDQVKRAQDDTDALTLRLARLRSQDQALSNIKDTLNVSAAAKAAIGDSAEILFRLKELALQSTSEALSVAERATIQIEFDSLKMELDRLAATNDRAPVPVSGVGASRDSTAIATAAPAPTTRSGASTGVERSAAAAKMSTLTHDLIVDQTDVSVLAQANQDPAEALKLLDET